MTHWSKRESLGRGPKENSKRLSTKIEGIIQKIKGSILQGIKAIKRRATTNISQKPIIILLLTSICIHPSKTNGTKLLAGCVARLGIQLQDVPKGKNQSLIREKRQLLGKMHEGDKRKMYEGDKHVLE